MANDTAVESLIRRADKTDEKMDALTSACQNLALSAAKHDEQLAILTKIFYAGSALSFNVRDRMDSGRYGYGGAIPGAVRPMLDWTVERTS